jgi:hypothetical protein
LANDAHHTERGLRGSSRPFRDGDVPVRRERTGPSVSPASLLHRQAGSRSCCPFHPWSKSKVLPSRALDEYPEAAWDWVALSSNDYAIDIGYIVRNPSKTWNWVLVSNRNDVTKETILANPGVPWSRATASALGVDIGPQSAPDGVGMAEESPVESEEETVARIRALATRGLLDYETLRANIHLPLDFGYVSLRRFKAVLEVALEHPDLPWIWRWLSTDVSIEEHLNHFNSHVDFDPVHLTPSSVLRPGLAKRLRATIEIQCAFRVWRACRVVAAMRIQGGMCRAFWDPARTMCRRRLSRNASKWGLTGKVTNGGDAPHPSKKRPLD